MIAAFRTSRARLLLITLALAVTTWSLAVAGELPTAIVKAVTPPTIDGDAADWQWLKAEQSLRGNAGVVARFQAAYDTEHFYALVRVTDDSPLKNGATVPQEMLKGGDAVAFCFGGRVPEQRIMFALVQGKPQVIAMRPQWPVKVPYKFFTTAAGEVAMDFVGPVAGAIAAFKPTADGYVAELALPWKSLGFAPEDRTTIAFDAQAIFSDPSGSMNVATAWWTSASTGALSTMDIATEARLYANDWGRARFYTRDPGPRPQRHADDAEAAVFTGPGLPITFTMPRAARASLIITRADGWVVRELLRTRQLGKGAQTVYWDGRDRTGQPLPPGDYGYTLAIFDGIKTTFFGSVGNSARPVFRTPDGLGSMGGAHGGPSAVAADWDGIYLLNSGEEGPQCLRKVRPDGKAVWVAGIGVFAGGFAVTADGGSVYMIIGQHQGSARLTRLDAATGKTQRIGKKDGPIDLGKIAVRGAAVAGGKLYYSDQANNRLGVIDLKSGEAEADLAVPSPSGLCRRDETCILACSATSIVAITVADRTIATVIPGLIKPRAVAIDRAGAVYVSDLGTSQQIRKYAALGAGPARALATFGKPGGRALTVPTYDPLEFREVTGIACGPDGHLWMVEQSQCPRRYIRLTTDGKWLEDYYGPAGFSTVGVDLDDLGSLYYQPNQSLPSYVQARVDYAQYAKDLGNPVGAWQVMALWNMTQNGIDGSAQPDLMSESSARGYGKALVFTATNGRRYFWKPESSAWALWLWDQGRWRSVAAITRRKGSDGKDHGPRLWTDASGDGLAQDSEISSARIPFSGNWTWIDRDLTLHGQDGSWRPASIDAGGVPVYAGGVVTPVFPASSPQLAFYLDQENYGYSVAPPTADGVHYYCSNIGPERGQGFWDRASETRLTKVRNGQVEWIVGHHDGSLRHDGDNQMIMNLAGEIDGVVVTTEVYGGFTAYTADGLTLGWMILDDKGLASGTGPNSIPMENVAPGILVKDPKTGKRLLFASSAEDVRVLEIDGVFADQLVRQRGTVTLAALSPPPAATAATKHHRAPASTWALTAGSRYLGVDGYDWEWSREVAPLAIRQGGALVAEVRLRRDAGMLCIFANILDPAHPPLTDRKPDVAAQFGQVAGLELLLGPLLPADRGQATPGDTRIFLSAGNDAGDPTRGLALACRPGSPPLIPNAGTQRLDEKGRPVEGAKPDSAAIDFSNGLRAIPGATVIVKRRFDGHGYRIEAEIPLAAFPDLTSETLVQVKRQRDVNFSERRADLAAPLKFNAAVWIASVGGRMQRCSWMPGDPLPMDARAMTPAGWGTLNGQIELSWSDVDGATACNVYRGTTADPAAAVLVASDITALHASDAAGPGAFHYWLAPLTAAGEGQWYGPVRPTRGSIRFPAFDAAPPIRPEDLAKQPLAVFPGVPYLLNLAVAATDLTIDAPAGIVVKAIRRSARLWALVINASRPTSANVQAVRLTAAGTTMTLSLIPAAVPVMAYGVIGEVMTNVTGADPTGVQFHVRIDPAKPADGAAGLPATALGWMGHGQISQREIGRHGYVLPGWRGIQSPRRVVKAPFADTFADLKNATASYGRLHWDIDGDLAVTPGKTVMYASVAENRAGSAFTIPIRVTDAQPHLLTVVMDKRADHQGPPAEVTVTDPTSKRSWRVADLDGTHGCAVLQFSFIGAIDLTVTATAKSDEGYNKANISAVFLD